MLFHQDDPAAHLYLLTEGRVKVAVSDAEGREVVVSLLEAGDVLGELALLDDAPRSATVTALEDTAALLIGREDFLAVLDRDRRASRATLALLARTVRRISRRVEDLVFLDLHARVAKCLLDQSRLAGDRAELALTQEDVASYTGAARASVNEVLGELQRGGVIAVARRRITIADPEALRRSAER